MNPWIKFVEWMKKLMMNEWGLWNNRRQKKYPPFNDFKNNKYGNCSVIQFSSVQSLSRVRLFATPWIAARQASLSITNSPSSPKFMSIESVMPSSHLSLCRPFSSCPQSFPASGSFQMSQLFALGGQSIGVSASTSVLPMNIQDWSPLGWTGWIPLQSKGLSRVFSNTTVQNISRYLYLKGRKNY